jgi:hypothetical protein
VIVVCLLAAPARPSEPDVRDDSTSTLRVASRPYALATHVRRAGTFTVYAHSLFVVPDVDIDAPPARTMVLVALPIVSHDVDASIVLPPSARGPPVV